MKGKILAIFTVVLCLSFGTGKAQLLIGPSISGGMTYGKNYIVSDTSQYYISNSPGVAFGGGLDILYAFDENIRAQVGVAYGHRSFSLNAPAGREGLSFSTVDLSTTVISIPMTFHYRIPIGEGGSKYFNVIAGHSLDFTAEDSTVTKTPFAAIDSGGSFTRHEYHKIKRILPTVLLGVGADFESAKGNILNISLIWGLSTGRMIKGNIAEWEVLNQPFDPTNQEQELPIEFPEHYFDFSMRGSTLSLKLSYWFNMSSLFEKKDKEDDMGSSEE